MRGRLGAAVVAIFATCVISAAAGPAPGHGQKLVFGSNRADGQRDLYVVNEDGTGLHRLTFDGEDYRERVATWSPDGSRIAFAANHNGNFDIYTMDANGGDRRRVTTDPGRDDYPQWTSDGRIIYMHNLFACPCSEWIVNADGSNPQQLALQGNAAEAEMAPQGNRIAYGSFDAAGTFATLHVATVGPGNTVTSDHQITTPPHEGADQGDFEPHWSPNGNDLVFLRDHGNVDNDIFVVHSDGSGLKRLTNTPNRVEFWATWSSDGKSVLFQDASTGKLKAIDVESGTERPVGTNIRAPFTDDFSVPDRSVWSPFGDPGSTVGWSDGSMVATISASAVPSGQFNQVAANVYSQCSLSGDFDMQVDYDLRTWPRSGGFRAVLSHFDFTGGVISRASVPIPWAPSWQDEQVQGWTQDANGSFASSDRTGTFRLVRKAGLVVGYVRDGGAWRPAYSGHSGASAVFGFGLWTQGSDFAHQDGSVAFDNFRLDAGELTCPSWWQDVFPDVYFG